MAQLTIKTQKWHDKLTIIEKNDPVEGGIDGIDNKPHIELFDNIGFLKKQADDLSTHVDDVETILNDKDTELSNRIDETIGAVVEADGSVTLKSLLERIKTLETSSNKLPVGTLVGSKTHYQTDGDFAQAMGYGVWQRALQGRVPVGFSDIPSDPIEYRTHGAEYGSFEHQLTIDEMPSHHHPIMDGGNPEYSLGGRVDTGVDAPYMSYEDSKTIGDTGGDEPHPNQPPSLTIDWWERIS